MDIPLFGGTDEFWKHSGWSSQIQRLDLKVVWSSPTAFGSGHCLPGVEATAPVLGPPKDHEAAAVPKEPLKPWVAAGTLSPPLHAVLRLRGCFPSQEALPWEDFSSSAVLRARSLCRLWSTDRPQILVCPSLAAPAPHPRAHTEKGEVVHHPPCHLCPSLWVFTAVFKTGTTSTGSKGGDPLQWGVVITDFQKLEKLTPTPVFIPLTSPL